METSVNNKCRAFTSMEQSKKLAEFLPLDSADFVWLIGRPHTDGPRYAVIRTKNEVSEPENHWPCWSLSALLDVLPQGTRILKSSTNDTYHCD